MRRALGVVLLAVALVAGGLAFSASADNHNDDGDGNGNGTTMELTANPVEETELDLGKKGLSLGDRLVFSDDVEKDDETVGALYGECVIFRVESDSAVLNCIATVWLDDKGQMTLQGALDAPLEDTPDPFTLAITGGTGDFRGADGEVDFELSDSGVADLTVHLDD